LITNEISAADAAYRYNKMYNVMTADDIENLEDSD